MTQPISVAGMIVLVVLPDGKMRQVPLTGKQVARVRRFVTREHGGALHMGTKDLLVMSEADAMEVFEKLTGKLPIKERFRRLLDKLVKGEPAITSNGAVESRAS